MILIVLFFSRWSCEDVHVQDMSLQDYIAVKEKFARFLGTYLAVPVDA